MFLIFLTKDPASLLAPQTRPSLCSASAKGPSFPGSLKKIEQNPRFLIVGCAVITGVGVRGKSNFIVEKPDKHNLGQHQTK